MVIVIVMDYEHSHRFSAPNIKQAKIKPPLIEPNHDVIVHEMEVRKNDPAC